MDNPKAEAGAGASFGSEKGLEEAGKIGRWDARTRVLDGDGETRFVGGFVD